MCGWAFDRLQNGIELVKTIHEFFSSQATILLRLMHIIGDKIVELLPHLLNIGLMIGVGAPTSLAIDLANRFDMTLIGFVKEDSFNIYTNNQKVIVN